MIRIASFDSFEPKLIKDLCTHLYTAFGVGTEYTGELPTFANSKGAQDAEVILASAPKVSAFPDDKVLYLTASPLKSRKLPTGDAPSYGLAEYKGQRAVLGLSSFKSPLEEVKLIARFAMQEVGHTWGLHHCLDPKCAMYPPWTPSYLLGEPVFCSFCRDTSEAVIRLAKS